MRHYDESIAHFAMNARPPIDQYTVRAESLHFQANTMSMGVDAQNGRRRTNEEHFRDMAAKESSKANIK